MSGFKGHGKRAYIESGSVVFGWGGLTSLCVGAGLSSQDIQRQSLSRVSKVRAHCFPSTSIGFVLLLLLHSRKFDSRDYG